MIVNGTFSAQLLKHSRDYEGNEAITYLCTYERYIHAEVMTHRWSRNASSSRAIPIGKVIGSLNDPAMPLHYGKNKSGMQSGEEIEDRLDAQAKIIELLNNVTGACEELAELGLHKEVVNRYLEPWSWITSVMTMGRDQLMNFFNLRIHEDANPAIQRLAVSMARLYKGSIPQRLRFGEWHMPFIDSVGTTEDDFAWSVARCAWVSYNNPTKDATIEQARRRHDACVAYGHMTPCEHQLQAGVTRGAVPGFTSYRSTILNECATEFDFSRLDAYGERDYLIKG